jgi:hypothetical protein
MSANRWSLLAYWRTTTQERVDLEFGAILMANYTDEEEMRLVVTANAAMLP